MGIKDLDALAKTIKPFRQDICQTSTLNTCNDNDNDNDNGVSSKLADAVESSVTENQSSNQRQRQRRPDRAVYVPRGRRSQTTPPTTPISSTGSVSKTQVVDKESVDVIPAPKTALLPSQSNEISATHSQEPLAHTKESKVQGTVINKEDIASKQHLISQTIAIQEESPPVQTINSMENMANVNDKSGGSQIEVALNSNDKDYNEEKEFQRASKEINRRNRRIIKQTFDSDVLEINEQASVMPKQSPPAHEPKKINLPHSETQSSANSMAQAKRMEKASERTGANADVDDWEAIFDDNGECLDAKLMTEITTNVGKVSITKPKNDYKNFQEPIKLDDEEFPHVLEVSNFPAEFKTHDLMMVFSEYKDSGYDIKWVDDTHALVVFSSSTIAARVLNTGHSFVKLKPLKQATAESRAKAKKSALFLQPYRQRPETCAALARRLVTGALGVRLSTAREEREIERRVLKEAKERKLLAAKLRDEAWEN